MSMTLQEIITMADSEYANGLDNVYKCNILDQLQRRLFRMFKFPLAIERIDTVMGVGLYTLPEYIHIARIKNPIVIVSSDGAAENKYYRKNWDEELTGKCFAALERVDDSILLIYPTPSVSGNLINIFFEDGPNTLTSNDMTVVPRFFPDYHEIFVAYLKNRLAQSRKDYVMANNYYSDYEEMLQEATDHINEENNAVVQAEW